MLALVFSSETPPRFGPDLLQQESVGCFSICQFGCSRSYSSFFTLQHVLPFDSWKVFFLSDRLHRLNEDEFLLLHCNSGGSAAVLLPSSSPSLLLSAADQTWRQRQHQLVQSFPVGLLSLLASCYSLGKLAANPDWMLMNSGWCPPRSCTDVCFCEAHRLTG